MVAAGRTAVAGSHGALSGWHPAELGGAVLAAVLDGSRIAPDGVDELVVGTAQPVGAQGQNLSRAVVLAAGLPEALAGHVVEADRASGIVAVRSAAALIASGGPAVVAAAGVEVTSLVPPGAAALNRTYGRPWGDAALRRYDSPGGLVPVGVQADRLAERLGLERAALDGWAARSHARASARPARVISVVSRSDDRSDERGAGPVEHDLLPGTHDGDSLASLRPLHGDEAAVTAGTLAPQGDGAAVIVVTRRRTAIDRGLPILARLGPIATLAGSPVEPADVSAAVRRAVAMAGWTPAGAATVPVDTVEIDEPSAAHALATVDALGVEPDRVNPAGGTLAIGDPTAATGVRLVLQTIDTLRRLGGGRGVAATGADGGLAVAIAVDVDVDAAP